MAPEEHGFRGRIKRFQSEQQFIFLFWGLLLLLLLSPIIHESLLGKEIGAALQTMIFFAIIYTHINSKPLFICVTVMVAIALTSLCWRQKSVTSIVGYCYDWKLITRPKTSHIQEISTLLRWARPFSTSP